MAAARERRDNVRKRLADGEDPAVADKAEALAIANAFETIARNCHVLVADATFSTGCEFIADGGSLLL